eukprot:XP_022279558.1 uncharacterized protein LOC102151918 isoform X10 [Canis lupus familiaris]
MTIVTPIIQRKKLRLRDILPRWCGEGKSPRQDCSEKAPGEQGTQPGCLLLRSNTGRDRIHHFLILSGSYLRLTQDDDLTDLTERVLRDWTLPRGRNQSIYFTSEERVWQEAFKLDFSPYSSWISVPCAVNNLFNGTLQPSSLAWTTPDTLKGHGEGPTLSEAELLGTGVGGWGSREGQGSAEGHTAVSWLQSPTGQAWTWIPRART